MLALPLLSMMYEKLVMKQIVEFIENHERYQSTQPDIRTKHFTSTLLINP